MNFKNSEDSKEGIFLSFSFALAKINKNQAQIGPSIRDTMYVLT